MTATFGLVATLADPEPKSLASVSDLFVASMDAVAPKCPVRAPMAAALDGSFPTAIYNTSLDRYSAAGHPVIGVFSQEFQPGFLNGPLGVSLEDPSIKMDPTLNDAIDDFSLRVLAVCRQSVPHKLKGAWIWNEPNISDQPPIGVYPPAVKATALNPAAFGSVLYQTSRRLKKGAAVPLVYAGALTCLEQFHTNPNGDWVYGYLDAAYAYLVKHGKYDFNWDFLSVNMEGHVDAKYAAEVAAALRKVAAKYGHQVKLAVGEWGWQFGTAVDAVAAQSTYDALAASFDEVYFFEWQVNEEGYGVVHKAEGNGLIGLTGEVSPWHQPLVNLRKGPVPS